MRFIRSIKGEKGEGQDRCAISQPEIGPDSAGPRIEQHSVKNDEKIRERSRTWGDKGRRGEKKGGGQKTERSTQGRTLVSSTMSKPPPIPLSSPSVRAQIKGVSWRLVLAKAKAVRAKRRT